jgi:HPt (histidine-containing phosphotransfer) domain-containing protein
MRIEELFDVEALGELATLHASQGEEFMRGLLELFAADAHRALLSMRVSAWMGDAVGLAREAHRLKGSSGSFGARRLEAECRVLERCAREGDLGGLIGLEEQIEHALRVLHATREGIRHAELFRKSHGCCNMQQAA